MTDMRKLMIIAESADAATRMIDEADDVVQREASGHVTIYLSRRNDHTVEIDDMSATPMRQGWGSKALKAICDLADRHGVKLVGRIANESDDIWAERDDEDEDETVGPSYPSEDELAAWYERFGFLITDGIGSRIISRNPAGG